MGVRRNVIEKLELPKEVVLNLPLFTIVGKEEVTIENHKGIISYSEETIRIGTKVGDCVIHGRDLHLKQLTSDLLVICGVIGSVSFLM
ncbi:sporulation protein YqfC [Chakrabartyella piscis]|uniref:sporulation protein YqfC n=1 Tax=Chakrabartyella piscis TaxID=2918914 RepID=UPI002958935A|nr:sporulation protein YqfC [Chakrabartyella piscis]